MREIVIKVGCDDCGTAWTENETEVTEHIPVAFDGTTLEVDLCPRCREKKREAFAKLFACAHAPLTKRGNTRKKNGNKKAAVVTPVNGDAGLVCECGYVAKSSPGLSVHRTRSLTHREKVSA